VWSWFLHANAGRTGSGFGANPIAWADLTAFFGLFGITPRPWEVLIFKAFDRAYLVTNTQEEKTDG